MSAGFFQISDLHAGIQGSKLPSSSVCTMRGTERLGHCRWSLPRFSLAVALSTDAHILLARFSLLSLTWREAWRMWGASEVMMGNIASAHWLFGDGCWELLTEGHGS